MAAASPPPTNTAAGRPTGGGSGWSKKWNGLPIWGWVGLGGAAAAGVLLFLSRYHKASQAPTNNTNGPFPGLAPPIILNTKNTTTGPPGGGWKPPVDPTQPGQAQHSYTQTIDGETLKDFAYRVYGTANAWPIVLQANLEKLTAAANLRRLYEPGTPQASSFNGDTQLWSGIILETDFPKPPGVVPPARGNLTNMQRSSLPSNQVAVGVNPNPTPTPAGAR